MRRTLSYYNFCNKTLFSFIRIMPIHIISRNKWPTRTQDLSAWLWWNDTWLFHIAHLQLLLYSDYNCMLFAYEKRLDTGRHEYITIWKENSTHHIWMLQVCNPLKNFFDADLHVDIRIHPDMHGLYLPANAARVVCKTNLVHESCLCPVFREWEGSQSTFTWSLLYVPAIWWN